MSPSTPPQLHLVTRHLFPTDALRQTARCGVRRLSALDPPPASVRVELERDQEGPTCFARVRLRWHATEIQIHNLDTDPQRALDGAFDKLGRLMGLPRASRWSLPPEELPQVA